MKNEERLLQRGKERSEEKEKGGGRRWRRRERDQRKEVPTGGCIPQGS